jgi:integrase
VGDSADLLQFALPILTDWATRVDSLREITRSDVEHALADHRGRSEHNVHTALRSMFRRLKREKRIFSDPARGLVRHYARRLPRPLPSDRLRGLLDPLVHPREALIVASVAIHALGVDELASLQVSDLDRSADALTIARAHTTHRITLDETLTTLFHH